MAGDAAREAVNRSALGLPPVAGGSIFARVRRLERGPTCGSLMDIRLECLGGLRILADGRELTSLQQHRARLALLVFLAIEGRVRRDAVMATFWPESDSVNARHSLRQALYRLRQSLGDDAWLNVSGDELFAGDSLGCDGRDFEAAIARGDRRAAAQLYRGPFLHAVHLVDTPAWERWVDTQRTRFTRAHRLNCRDWVDDRLRLDDFEGALAAAQAWVAPDPLEDEAQHRLIELLALSGDRTAAIRQYESYARVLEPEGLTPLDETTEIYRGLMAPAPPDGAVRAVPAAGTVGPTDPTDAADGSSGRAGAIGGSSPALHAGGGAEVQLAPELDFIRLLGEGTVARVSLAREHALHRLVAVKVLRPELAADDVVRARFEREARAAARIRHPNVLAIHRVGRMADGVPYIVMEYIDGRTLADMLAARGSLSVEEVRRVLGTVAAALAAAHQAGVVHRDLRPANVLWEAETERVVLADFGLAALLETVAPDVRRITMLGEQLGDPTHMSPEQVRGEPATPQSDVYALGVIAYELLTGAGPFVGDVPAVLSAHLTMEPPHLPDLRADVDLSLAGLVRRCLAKVPDQRPRASEVRDVLLGAQPSPVDQASRVSKRGEEPLADLARTPSPVHEPNAEEARALNPSDGRSPAFTRWVIALSVTIFAAALLVYILRNLVGP